MRKVKVQPTFRKSDRVLPILSTLFSQYCQFFYVSSPVVGAYGKDAHWAPPLGGVPGTASGEETSVNVAREREVLEEEEIKEW